MAALPRPDAVLFDWDSTLVDNWGAITRALATTFTAMGRTPWNEDEVRANAKKSVRDTFPTLFGARAETATKLFYDSFEAVHLETLTALDGAEDLLAALADRGVLLGVVSNKAGRYLRREAEHLGWDVRFHRIIGATDAARDKPAPDPVHLALSESPVRAGTGVWFVGDSAVDLACAVASGCTPILLHPDDPHPEDLSDYPRVLKLSGCRSLLRRLDD